MTLVLALLSIAVVAWPAARVQGRPCTVEAHASSAEHPASTVEDAADAVVLLALALRGGSPVIDALEAVAQGASGQVRADLLAVAAGLRWGLPEGLVWHRLDPCWRPVAQAWSAAHRAGVGPAELLVGAAERMREHEAHVLEGRMQRATVLLVLPLGGLFLPGFVATTVIPVVIHLLGGLSR